MDTEITDAPSKADIDALVDGLNEFNYSTVPRDYRELGIFLREGETLIGGAYGASVWDWMHVKYLWIHPNHRKSGVGTRIMTEVEREARRRGCIGIHVDTFTFQALPFYEKNGFEVFGVIEDYPVGYKRCYLKKLIHESNPAGA